MFDTQLESVPIAILDFGSQFTHLISRRLRDAGVYCEIFAPDISVSNLEARHVQGIVLSGGPSSVYDKDKPEFNESILSMDVPILGICYGYQLMAALLGGTVIPGEFKEFGRADLQINHDSLLFRGMLPNQVVWMSHGDSVVTLPPGFSKIGETTNCANAVAENSTAKRYGLQFHCEVAHTQQGKEILVNFAVGICGCEANWNMGTYLDSIGTYIERTVRDRNVFLLVSGGIDSTVLFFLLNRVLGPERVKGVSIDTGLLRPKDPELIKKFFADQNLTNCLFVDASEKFLSALAGISDPEQKRNIIGQLFLDVKDRVMEDLQLDPEHWILAQGTIYPDIITSGGGKHAKVIKTHHNALPSLMNLEVLEPLRYLYKDEVRKLAQELQFPHEFIWKHPFPGPGIAVRIAGVINRSKLDLYYRLDEVVEKHLRKSGWYESLWMGFPILIDMKELAEPDFDFSQVALKGISKIVHRELQRFSTPFENVDISVLPIRSVGVKGDYRTFEHPVELRILNGRRRSHVPHQIVEDISKEIANKTPLINRVLLTLAWADKPSQWRSIVVLRMLSSVDTLTSDWAKLEHELLDAIASEILGLCEGLDAVLLDVTQKPPGTMEWE